MNQDDRNQKQPRQPLIIPKRPIVRETPMYQHTSESPVFNSATDKNESAANVLRADINTIYKNDPESSMAPEPAAPAPIVTDPTPTPTPVQEAEPKPAAIPVATQPAPAPTNELVIDPYEKTHSEDNLRADEEKWREYHSAWQNYYQQYFYRHYAGYLHEKDTALEAERNKHDNSVTDPSGVQGSITENEALNSLRSELRSKIRNSTQKARKSRHFAPIAVSVSVMLVFVFLQYNTQVVGFFASFVSPGNVIPENIIVDESIDIPVDSEPKLIIPKINVSAPITYDVSNDQASQLKAMENGVAWFGIPGASSKPGQVGNTVLSAHSTNNILETGDYKFLFLHLPELKKGDTAYVNNDGVRYTYKVTKTEIVKPNQVDRLVYKTDVPVMTLITCVPIGTAENRLLVTAEQISPSLSKSKPAPTESEEPEPAKLTGNSPSFLEQLFGAS